MTIEMPLWTPSEDFKNAQPLSRFMTWLSEREGTPFPDVDALHVWSVENRDKFWSAIWDFCGVEGEKGEHALIDDGRMLEARFFPDARLNFAQNLLRQSGETDALIFRGEDKVSYRWSWDELKVESPVCNRLLRQWA